ncbi:MAG TPA: triose-phosphate isomerase [Candidatus Thermoplasmatota archaeon]|nr:triose-phosphate isomerase [Candidatus Thermoplasmatota archaeon]
MFPRIVVNAKAYAEATGPGGLSLLRALERVAKAEPVGLAPPTTDLALLAGKAGKVSLFAQHADPLLPGVGTGFVSALAVQAAGAVGSLLNHAEHKIPLAQTKATVLSLHGLGLWSLLCADSLEEARALARLRPTAIAIEPPELIGGDVSVTSADPGIVSRAVKAVHRTAPETLVLCGAGVKSGADVAAARKLGAYGVLVASGVVKAQHPGKAAQDLASGLA